LEFFNNRRKPRGIAEIVFDTKWLRDAYSLVDASIFGGMCISNDLALDIVLEINAFLEKQPVLSLMEEYYETFEKSPKLNGYLTNKFKRWVKSDK